MTTGLPKSHQLQSCRQTVIARRVVRLSFDDGPNPTTTPPLLDHLRDHGVKATFFVLGQNIVHQEGRAILERIACDGHQIGNHSYSHADLTKLTAKQIEDEIKQTEALIGSLDNGIKLFRPPFGFHNSTVDEVVRCLGYRFVLWNVISRDWEKYYSNRRWVSHTMKQIEAKQDSTVLAHDVHPSTVAHFPELVRAIRSLPNTEFHHVAYHGRT